jgi:hypothetical protein
MIGVPETKALPLLVWYDGETFTSAIRRMRADAYNSAIDDAERTLDSVIMGGLAASTRKALLALKVKP